MSDSEVTYIVDGVVKIVSIFATVTSLFLLFIYIRCPLKRVQGYRWFFLLTAIQDVVLALGCLFLLPVAVTYDFSGVFVAIGAFRHRPLGTPLLIIFGSAFVFSLLIITNSFVYRYLHLCHIDFVRAHSSNKWICLIMLISFLFATNWFVMLWCNSWRDEEFLEEWNPIIYQDTGLKLDEAAYFGFKMTHMTDVVPFVLLCENGFCLFVLMCTNGYCAIRIIATLRGVQLNRQMNHHKKLFLLLMLQAACPTVFMYTPMGFMFLLLLSGTRSTVAMTTVIRGLYAIFPDRLEKILKSHTSQIPQISYETQIPSYKTLIPAKNVAQFYCIEEHSKVTR
ncbi:hypothetical protein GCK32_012174 [Trichostrongylus colubriformis]|uniref:G protein-coupled receptor n=1 Tax=Trichostrongylus colubriformis TaxID=6319 RepID=A0AAN8G3P7_TRICO